MATEMAIVLPIHCRNHFKKLPVVMGRTLNMVSKCTFKDTIPTLTGETAKLSNSCCPLA